jgi:phosphatidylserine/phosphatidylglycerophosphate/cardiolipin synthase-like enzyme
MLTFNAKVEAIIGSDYYRKVSPVIRSASQKIDIIMYEWKWYSHEFAGGVQQLNNEIISKAREKVNVRVLLNIESMGHAITKINSRTASFLQQRGVIVKFGQVGVATHAKMVIVDDRFCVVGSHNFSKGSFTRNQECSVLIEGGEAIRPFIDYFKLLWDQF